MILRIKVLSIWVSKIISQLVWFYIATLSDWLKQLTPLSQLNRRNNQNQLWVAFTRFPALDTGYMYFRVPMDWFITLSATVVIGQSDYFGFGFDIWLKTTLIES